MQYDRWAEATSIEQDFQAEAHRAMSAVDGQEFITEIMFDKRDLLLAYVRGNDPLKAGLLLIEELRRHGEWRADQSIFGRSKEF